MPLNIPLPGLLGDTLRQGFETGSNAYSKFMQPILEREKQRQLAEQFGQEQAFNKDKFLQELALKKAEAARANELLPLRKLLLNAQMQQAIASANKSNRALPAETPEQKDVRDINKALVIDEQKANRKKLDEIEKTAQALLPYVGKVNTISDILARKPDLAGRTTQLADLLGLSKDEDIGTFLSAAQALQAHMAKEMSSRGGYGVSKLVEQAKPNIGKSTAYNVGVVKELKQGMKESFEQMKSEYERLSNGKKFPYNFEQYFEEVTGNKDHNKSTQSANKKRVKFNITTGRLE